VQRKDTRQVINENPSLQPQHAQILADAYENAVVEAYKETGIEVDVFPETCPWTLEQTLDNDFWPGDDLA
jgi:hypothetical protein